MSPESANSAVTLEPTFRRAEPADGKAMYELVQEMGGLELNTAYFYILFCIDFADTCVVAEVDGKLAGFVLGHRPPKRPDAVFVWQVGVAPWMRKRGLARKLLEAFLAQNPDARWLEASVTPDNTASRKLFKSVARDRGVDCEISDYMPAELFPGGHEAEDLFRIGPFDSNSNQVGKQ